MFNCYFVNILIISQLYCLLKEEMKIPSENCTKKYQFQKQGAFASDVLLCIVFLEQIGGLEYGLPVTMQGPLL